MTWFVNMRERGVAGAITDPVLVENTDLADPDSLRPIEEARLSSLAGRPVVFITHGFNVNRRRGVAQLSRLEGALLNGVATAADTQEAIALPAGTVVLGVLWPGDFWLPVINYPFEGSTAADCGRRLAQFCATRLGAAGSFSFVSHSLGARLVLEAAAQLHAAPATLCLTAAAVNAGCLDGQYTYAAGRSRRVYNLASGADQVLRLAFPVGDFLGDLLNEDDGRHFEAALGAKGARPPNVPPSLIDRVIPDRPVAYGHGDYLPPENDDPGPNAKWRRPAGFMARAVRGEIPAWPPA